MSFDSREEEIVYAKYLQLIENSGRSPSEAYDVLRQSLPRELQTALITVARNLGTIRERDYKEALYRRQNSVRDIGPVSGPMVSPGEQWFDRQTTRIRLPENWPTGARDTTPSEDLKKASELIKKLTETLERVKKEPLWLYRAGRISEDKKHTFIKKGDMELRIEACPDLKYGDEILLHPKSLQIVEHLGRPPLEESPFAPADVPTVSWSDIGGLEQAKMDMQEAIEHPFKHKSLYKFYNKKMIKGILLSGPPGCGKTMLGKAAANSIAKIHKKESVRTGFLYVKGPEILNQYVGQTEQTIRDIFFDAKRHLEVHGYPAVVFLDEADSLLAARGSRLLGLSNTIVPQFLTEMDGLEESAAIVIIATNRPDVLDPAIVRDGRIDRRVTVTRPNEFNGRDILAMKLAQVPLAGKVTVEELSEKVARSFYHFDRYIKPGVRLSEVVNGAMLVNCIELATSIAMRRDLESGEQTGINLADCEAAIMVVQKQALAVRHDLEVG